MPRSRRLVKRSRSKSLRPIVALSSTAVNALFSAACTGARAALALAPVSSAPLVEIGAASSVATPSISASTAAMRRARLSSSSFAESCSSYSLRANLKGASFSCASASLCRSGASSSSAAFCASAGSWRAALTCACSRAFAAPIDVSAASAACCVPSSAFLISSPYSLANSTPVSSCVLRQSISPAWKMIASTASSAASTASLTAGSANSAALASRSSRDWRRNFSTRVCAASSSCDSRLLSTKTRCASESRACTMPAAASLARALAARRAQAFSAFATTANVSSKSSQHSRTLDS
mmetsp:Transcript_29008/g.73641  ORF Transcript_29008/g.73641 Transcript_29008/m.73641 type:complete len:296 (+) Transcript_29008:161-1048(+)